MLDKIQGSFIAGPLRGQGLMVQPSTRNHIRIYAYVQLCFYGNGPGALALAQSLVVDWAAIYPVNPEPPLGRGLPAVLSLL